MNKSLQIEISATFLKNSRCKVETIILNREWTLIMQKWVFLTPDEMKPPLDWVMRGGTPEGGQQAWRCFETLMRGIQGDLPEPTTRNQMENPDVLDISCRDEVHLYRCQQEPMPPLLPTLWLCERSPEFRLNPGNGVVGKTTNWLKNTCFEWENSDLTKSVFKTVRITFCYQAEWGHEMKIKLSYKKRNECMTCENSSATRVLSLSCLTLGSHSAQKFGTLFLHRCLKSSDKGVFCCFNWSYFERAGFCCGIEAMPHCFTVAPIYDSQTPSPSPVYKWLHRWPEMYFSNVSWHWRWPVCPGLPRVLWVLAIAVLCPGKPFRSPWETRRVGHPCVRITRRTS